MSGDNQADHELKRRMRQNPTQVLSEEYARHRVRLFQIVKFRLDPKVASRLEPDDVLQESWIAALSRIDSFLESSDVSFFVWLRWIVCQTVVDLHRHHLGTKMRDAYREITSGQRDLQRSTAASMIGQIVAALSTPSQIAIREESAKQIQDAVESMDEIDREVLALRHFEELTNNEVAVVLNITPKTASIRYVRALQRLKKTLDAAKDAVTGDTSSKWVDTPDNRSRLDSSR